MLTNKISIGLENFLVDFPSELAGKRLGLLSNQASTDHNLVHARILLQQKFGSLLTCLFSPSTGSSVKSRTI